MPKGRVKGTGDALPGDNVADLGHAVASGGEEGWSCGVEIDAGHDRMPFQRVRMRPPVSMFQILAVLSQLRWVEESLIGGEGSWVYGVERNVTHAVVVCPSSVLMHSPVPTCQILAVLPSLPVARRVGFLGWKATHFHTACVPTKRQDAVSMPVSMFHILAVPSPIPAARRVGSVGWKATMYTSCSPEA